MKKILLTGGGSAGHVIPNIALIPDLEQDYELAYIGTNGIEKEIVKRAKLPFYTIEASKFVRGSILKNLTLPFKVIKSVRQAKKGLEIIKPDAVFSKGGYVSLPVAIAAKKMKIPVISHESDLNAGLANKLIAKYSKCVLTSFPETATTIKKGKFSGPPLRKELFNCDKQRALSYYGFTGSRPVLLIFGGGSGSCAINKAIRDNIFALTRTFDVLHICGKNNIVSANIKNYIQKEFETDMPLAYSVADIIISRAGSNTLFEIIALKKKALVIPLENKRSRGDQIDNANYFKNLNLINVFKEEMLKDNKLFVKKINETYADDALKNSLNESEVCAGNYDITNEISRYCN